MVLIVFGVVHTADGEQQRSVQPALVAPIDTLRGQELGLSDVLALPINLLLVGEYLLIDDARAESPFHAIRLTGQQSVASFGLRGRGPSEVRGVAFLARDPVDDQAFWAYDIVNTRLVGGHVGTSAGMRRSKSVRVQSEGPAFEMMRWGTGWIGHGMFAEGRFLQFSNDGRPRGHLGALPDGDGSVPAQVLQHAFQSTFDTRPDSSLIVIATKHADRLEIWSPDGSRVVEADRPSQFEPIYEVGSRDGAPVMASGGDMRFGYVRVRSTQDRIYALYSGYTRAERPGAAHLGWSLRVFSWDGMLLRDFPLDYPLMGLEVDSDRGVLYGARHTPTPEVLSYPLPR